MSFAERCHQRCEETRGDEGFTLVELLVVLLIIGILLAIAIPTFLSVTAGANTTATQANLQSTLTGADAYYLQANLTYTGILSPSTGVSSLTAMDTGMSVLQNGISTGPSVISVHVDTSSSPSGQALILVGYAPSGRDCWGILDLKSPASSTITSNFGGVEAVGTYYFTYDVGTATTTTCNANSATATTLDISSRGWPHPQ